jgi:diadenosine tetraphosphate (Ap4A) HIT family hydrolase
MSRTLFSCAGGSLALPAAALVLVDRADGGNLIVEPPRDVWERSELTAQELYAWSALVAAAGRAMIDTLPQLAGGCVNYWDAGNWALNTAAEPRGLKDAAAHRHVHLHLLGRSPGAVSPAWRWGEAPAFPDFADRFTWAAGFRRLTAAECHGVVRRTRDLLAARYGTRADDMAPVSACPRCEYPLVSPSARLCGDCAGGA